MSFLDEIKLKEDEYDFPFYDGNPEISKIKWLVLALGIIVYVVIMLTPLPRSFEFIFRYGGLIFFIILFIPLLYATSGKLGLFFKKISFWDIKLIFTTVVLSFIYSAIVKSFLSGFSTVSNSRIDNLGIDLISLIDIFIQIMSEELFKIILLLILLYVFYNLCKNKKLSLIISSIITLVAFGLMHVGSYGGNLLILLILIGLGSIFDLYAYIKTKNIFVSFLAHAIYDAFPILAMILLSGFI